MITAPLLDADIPAKNQMHITVPENGMPTDPQEKARLVFQAIEGKKMCEQVLAMAKADLEEGGEIEGYSLRQGSTTRALNNTLEAFKLLRDDLGELGEDEYLNCCKPSIPQLQQLYALKGDPNMSMADRKAKCLEVLGSVITEKQGSPRLVEDKPYNRQ